MGEIQNRQKLGRRGLNDTPPCIVCRWIGRSAILGPKSHGWLRIVVVDVVIIHWSFFVLSITMTHGSWSRSRGLTVSMYGRLFPTIFDRGLI